MWAPDGRHLAVALANGLEIVRAADGTAVFQGEGFPSNWLSPTELGVRSAEPGQSFAEAARIVDLSASPPEITRPDPSFDTDQLLIGQLPGLDFDVAESLLQTAAMSEPLGTVLGGASYRTALTVVGQAAERIGGPPYPMGILVSDGQEAFRVDVEPLWSLPGVQARWGHRVSFVISD
jgi:hypothetical protein